MVHAANSGGLSDALRRAWATFGQGMAVSVLVAVGGVLKGLADDGPVNWGLIGASCGQAAVTAVVTYLHRRFISPADKGEDA